MQAQSQHKFKPGDRVVINSEDEQVTIWQCTFWNGLPAYWVREWSDVIPETGLRKYEPIHINQFAYEQDEIKAA